MEEKQTQGVQPLEGIKLFPYQLDAICFAEARDWKVLIADEMGTGKTFQGLGCISQAQAYPCVVVCPSSLKLNWESEISRALPGKSVQVIRTGKDKIEGTDFIVVNYELLKVKLVGKYARNYELGDLVRRILDQGPNGIIVDESHYCKGEKSKRTQAVEALSQHMRARILLTGTPVVNRPAELIPQLRILGLLDLWFGGKWKFAKRYCRAYQGKWGWDISGSSNLEELNSRLSEICMLRRTKAEVLPELGNKEYFRVILPLSNRDEYEYAEEEFLDYLRQKKGRRAAARASSAESFAKLATLRQLAGIGKTKAAVEWCSLFLDAEEPLIVFAAHIDTQNALAKAFKGSCVTIMGKDSINKRHEAVKKFQESTKPMIAVCSLKAAAEGITLTRARHVAFLEQGWTPKDQNQASDRVHRIGQTRDVTVWKLIATDTIDGILERVIDKKTSIVDKCVDGTARTEMESESAQQEVLQHYESVAKIKKGSGA